MRKQSVKQVLDGWYDRFHRHQQIHPDPLEFLYNYPDLRDREIVGLVAASLAFGRVASILKSVESILSQMKPSPYRFLCDATESSLSKRFMGFRHRWATGTDVALLLGGAKRILERFGSLQACFVAGVRPDDETLLPALAFFVEELRHCARKSRNCLLASPQRGSACKRLNLYLRWMVRCDDVDPGGWEGVSAAKLVVPLDVHMHRFCLSMRWTKRKQPNIRAALEATEAFREIAPSDPVRYDFAITRLAMQNPAELEILCRGMGARG